MTAVETYTGNDLDRLHRVGYPITLEPIEATHRTMLALERALTPPGHSRQEYHGYVALSLEHFLDGMQRCAFVKEEVRGEEGGPRFLDIGCGIGTKAVLAHYLGWHAEGLEFHRPYVDVAKRIVPSGVVHHADAGQWTHYHGYQLLYSWRPALDNELQQKINDHIAAHAMPGTLLFLPSWDRPIVGCDRLDHELWRVCG